MQPKGLKGKINRAWFKGFRLRLRYWWRLKRRPNEVVARYASIDEDGALVQRELTRRQFHDEFVAKVAASQAEIARALK